jgi:hypothetical protein
MTEPSYARLVCYNHPDRETVLRCNRCNRPICTSCAVLTPTGYRCKECVRGQQKVYETAQSLDPVIGFVIAAVLAFIGSYSARIMGFFTVFLAPLIGLGITEAVRYAVKKRRSHNLFLLATAGAAVGSLPFLVTSLITLVGFLSFGGGLVALGPLVWQGLYSFLIASTVYYRLSGIQI